MKLGSSRLLFLPHEVHVFHPSLDSFFAFLRKGFSLGLLMLAWIPIYAASGGSISGTVADPSGALIVGATLKLVNTAQQTIWQAVSDERGLYSFPEIPVGHYDLTITAAGFTVNKKTGISVDTDVA